MPTYRKANSCLNCPYQSGSFSFLNVSEKKSIQKNCLIANFKKGENIIKQGQNPKNAIYVSKGLVKVFLQSEKRNIILKLVNSGEYTALSTIFNNTAYSYSISTIEESRVCMVNAELFRHLAKENKEFMLSITEQMAEEANFILKKLRFINQRSVRSRLADIIIFLSKKIYKSNNFELSLTRQELGEMISLTRENTARVLSDFQKEKVIEINGKKIKIINNEILQTIKTIG